MREDITGRKSGFFYRELHDISLRIGAQEKTRTSTTIQSLAPEASASTNSATWASSKISLNSIELSFKKQDYFLASGFRTLFRKRQLPSTFKNL